MIDGIKIIFIYDYRKLAREEAEKNGEDPEEAAVAVEATMPDEEEPTEVKYAVRSGPYELCRKAGLGKFMNFACVFWICHSIGSKGVWLMKFNKYYGAF